MKQHIAVLAAAATSFLAAHTAHASDVIVPGSRVRVSTADIVEVPGLLRVDTKVASGLDPRTDNESGTVTVKSPDGSRMRFAAPRRTLVGEIIALDGEMLVMKLDGRDVRVSVPLSAIAKTEISVGKTERRHGKGALLGLGIGTLLGGTIGILLGDDACGPASGDPFGFGSGCALGFTAAEKGMVLGILGGGAGAVVGLVAGASPTDKWTGVILKETPKIKLSVRPLGYRGVSLHFGF